MRIRRLTVALLIATGLVVVPVAPAAACACGGVAPQPGSEVSVGQEHAIISSADGVQQITVLVGDDYLFVPDSFTVAPGQVRLTLTSIADQLTHNLVFTPGMGPVDIAEGVPILAPGDSETFDFTIDPAANLSYLLYLGAAQ